ncbi:MAG: outer membrane lipoprotein chaperone LolA [Gammaproteobacteria bacterium]|nr:outer membrane lipoprotein chaperone LolA [Gammaproteobacteria bacterium]
MMIAHGGQSATFCAVALLLVLLVPMRAGADDAPQLAKLLDGMTTLSAEFEQTVTNRFGDVLQAATGRMHLKRPMRLRWELDEPYPQLVVTNGETLWVYDPDLEQVTVQPLAEALTGSPAVFLTGTVADLRRNFSVLATEPPEAGGSRFELTPVDPNAVYGELALTFAADGSLAGIDIADHLDQLTRVAFTVRDDDAVLESDLFEFTVPTGVDVIGDVSRPPGR